MNPHYAPLTLPVLGPLVAVMDACAMIAYLRGEPGGEVVNSVLSNPANACHAHVFNLLEVYYIFRRAAGEARADAAVKTLFADGIALHHDLDETFWKEAGGVKADHSLAIGDCFCLTLARRIGGEVFTSDHAEFDPLVPLGLCAIHFIR